jgi:glycosyltransferase involved in cell wall biosynthesis
MKFAFIAYNYSPGYSSPEQWIARIRPLAGIMEAMAKTETVYYIGRIDWYGEFLNEKVQYFFPEKKDDRRLPRSIHKLIREIRPDIIFVLGMIFPLQIIQLRMKIGRNCKIIVQHHANPPSSGLKRIAQRIADRYVDAYFFSSFGNAKEWIDAGIIRNPATCYEMAVGSTNFSKLNKEASRRELELPDTEIFLWVGRLDVNKDPLTVLKGFGKYIQDRPDAKLYMIYQDEEILSGVSAFIDSSPLLKNAVTLVGEVEHHDLQRWYSASDFFISGSHKEGGSYALLEAMACGCIPIVTDIPASLKMIASGKFGFSYWVGNDEHLYQTLQLTSKLDREEFSGKVAEYFISEWSFDSVAAKRISFCKKLLGK